MFEKPLTSWKGYMESLKTNIKKPFFLVLIVWLGLSVLVCRLARWNENKGRTLEYNVHIIQSSKEKDDSIWKKQVLDELADMRQFKMMCSIKLDSLNKKMTRTIVELREVNKRLKTTKFK